MRIPFSKTSKHTRPCNNATVPWPVHGRQEDYRTCGAQRISKFEHGTHTKSFMRTRTILPSLRTTCPTSSSPFSTREPLAMALSNRDKFTESFTFLLNQVEAKQRHRSVTVSLCRSEQVWACRGEGRESVLFWVSCVLFWVNSFTGRKGAQRRDKVSSASETVHRYILIKTFSVRGKFKTFQLVSNYSHEGEYISTKLTYA